MSTVFDSIMAGLTEAIEGAKSDNGILKRRTVTIVFILMLTVSLITGCSSSKI